MTGRPKGITDSNARRERLSIPLTTEEKTLLVEVARAIAAERGFPDTPTASVLRTLWIEAAINFQQRKIDEQNPDNLPGSPGVAVWSVESGKARK